MNKQFQTPMNPQIGEALSFYTTKSFVSWGIRLFSPGVNHIETFALNPDSEKIECISARTDGVSFKPIDEIVRHAKGTIRYHKLRPEIRKIFDAEKCNQCAIELDGVSYDYLHLLGVGIDDVHINWLKIFPKVPDWVIKMLKTQFFNEPTKKAAVCSGVWTWLVLNYGLGLDTTKYNPSEVTPHQAVMYDIFEDTVTLNGKIRPIRDYSSIKIEGV